jgi:LmbE family N-acetylglucosaminyl deacetylase
MTNPSRPKLSSLPLPVLLLVILQGSASVLAVACSFLPNPKQTSSRPKLLTVLLFISINPQARLRAPTPQPETIKPPLEPHLNILILSPHRDDAAFSLALAIETWLTAGHTVTLLNVFTRSVHAPYSDADFIHDNDRLSYVSAMRLREDELFLQRLTQPLRRAHKAHLLMIDLNLKDAPIRLRIPADALCDTPVNPEDPAIEKIRKALTRQSELSTLEALVLPAALGNQVDHLTVREAALPLAATLPSAFYEDLPYAATHPRATADLDALQNAAAKIGELLNPILYPMQTPAQFESFPEAAVVDQAKRIARKRHLALGYASQIDEEAANLIANFATRYHAAERLWANRQWLEVFAST